MISWLINLPPIIGGSIAITVTVGVGLLTYILNRSALGRYSDDRSAEIAINMFRFIATLLSLLLSLTFTDVRLEIISVKSSVEREVDLISDIYKDLTGYDTKESIYPPHILTVILSPTSQDRGKLFILFENLHS